MLCKQDLDIKSKSCSHRASHVLVATFYSNNGNHGWAWFLATFCFHFVSGFVACQIKMIHHKFLELNLISKIESKIESLILLVFMACFFLVLLLLLLFFILFCWRISDMLLYITIFAGVILSTTVK